MKNEVTLVNTIVLQSYREINSSLESERKGKINSNISIPGNRNISYEQNIELLDKLPTTDQIKIIDRSKTRFQHYPLR